MKLSKRESATISGRVYRSESGEIVLEAFELPGGFARVRRDSESRIVGISAAVSGLADSNDISVDMGYRRCKAPPYQGMDANIDKNIGEGIYENVVDVVLRRDRFGRLPLYWAKVGNELYFSTRCRDLANRIGCSKINPESFVAYSSFSFVPAPLSPYEEINSISAGSSLRFVIGEEPLQPVLEMDQGWSIAADGLISDESIAIEKLHSILLEAIEVQTHGLKNEEVAVFLSGGLDSALTAAALKRAGARVTAYSLDFGSYGKSELPQSVMIAEHLQIPLVKVACTPREIRRNLLETVSALDTVFGDGVTVPLFLLARAAARDGHKIAFNGEGGDQLFGGWTNKPLIASSVYSGNGDEAANTNLPFSQNQLYENYLNTFHKIYGFEQNFFSTALQECRQQLDLRRFLAKALERRENISLMHMLRRANLMLKGAQNIQPRASNIAMHFGLNLRSLFCDNGLANFTFTLAPDLLLRGSCEKYILKRAVEDWLPSTIVFQEKRGMGAPLTEWCTGPLWADIGRHLNPRELESSGYWQKDIVERIALCEINAAWQGRRIGEILWLVWIWELWLKNSQGLETRGYNPFWPPLQLLRLKKEVFDRV